MAASLIGNVVVEPATPRPGETIKVSVVSEDGLLLDEAIATVTVNGARGALRYLQFPSVGQRRIAVTARKGQTVDRRKVTVDVSGEPILVNLSVGLGEAAILGVTQSASEPYVAILTLGSVANVRATPPPLVANNPPILGTYKLTRKRATSLVSSRSTLARALTKAASDFLVVDKRSIPQPSDRARVSKRPIEVSKASVIHYDLSGSKSDPTPPPPKFEWDFGDGQTLSTASPMVTHDYFRSMAHGQTASTFHVSCRMLESGIVVRRTLQVESTYALCRRRGTIVPHVTSDVLAHKHYLTLTGSLTVHNVEDAPLVLDHVSVTPLAPDGESLSLPAPFKAMNKPVTVAPNASTVVSVNVPFVTEPPKLGEIDYRAPGFSITYAGTCNNMPVRCTAVFEVPIAEQTIKPHLPEIRLPTLYRKPWPWELVTYDIRESLRRSILPIDARAEPVVDVESGTLSVGLAEKAGAARAAATMLSSFVHSGADKAMLAQRRAPMTARMHAPASLSLESDLDPTSRVAWIGKIPTIQPVYRTMGGTMGPPDPGPVAEGQICDPENLTEEELALADEQQLVCQLTDEVREVVIPARWVNARKGDCILSPGGDGFIGGLMLQVNPPQWYSHSGIMTRNYDEITHSTGSKAWLMDNLVGMLEAGADGFSAVALKYVWPGAVTQSVESSVAGEDFVQPWSGKSYKISSFGKHIIGVTHNDQMKMIPPLVLKPDPMLETPAVRTALHLIASDARADGGRPTVKSKYHYRWYCYTDPTIGRGAPAGSDATWADGTRPSVCSSFIWLKATARGAKLEAGQPLVTPTDLEPGDVTMGAAVRPVTPEGLYLYTAAERLDAGEWLYDEIYNQAFDKAGWFGNWILTDAADDTANQFLNTFASDDSANRDDDDWRDTQDADAISPDNMLWWDGPDTGGLYGYLEPALYREPRLESYTVSKWKKVLSRGTIRGTVRLPDGTAVGGALVQVYESKSDFSGADGTYELTDVPFGTYLIKASKVIDNMLQSTQVSRAISTADLVVDLVLQPPADRYRIAQVFVDFWGRDDEWAASDEIHDPGPQYFELELGPDKLVNSIGLEYKWGGELRVEYTITVRLLVNNTIDVAVKGLLYEGTDEETKDLDGQGDTTFLVEVDKTAGTTMSITNTDEDDPDEGKLTISVKNVRNYA